MRKKGPNFYEDRFRGRNWLSRPDYAADASYSSKPKRYRDEEFQKPHDVFLGGIPVEKLTELEEIWRTEIGFLVRFCDLLGIRSSKNGPCLVVRPKTAVAASEINLRASEIVRALNKHFPEPWIKGLKIDSKI